jgi:hypothetical protein
VRRVGIAAVAVAQIDATTTAWARMISAFQVPGYGAARDEFCRAHGS